MKIDRIRKALGGISGIHVTPYDDSGEVCGKLLKPVIDGMTKAGIHNIVSCGNTGEYFSLTFEEVLRVQDAAVTAVAGRTVATAAIGRSLREASATAKAAMKMGFDAVMAHHPLDPFASPHGQAAYFLELAEASELPLVAYLRSALPANDIVRIATHHNVAGVKFANANLLLFADCVTMTAGQGAVWVCGLAEGWAAPFYALGGRGFTSGLVNVAPHISMAIWRALEQADFKTAARLVVNITPFEVMRTMHNGGANVTVVKEAMELLGVNVGPVRLPGLDVLDAVDREKLRTILSNWSVGPERTITA